MSKPQNECKECRNDRDPSSKSLCRECLEYKREGSRKRSGSSPWKPGSRGRPPIDSNYMKKKDGDSTCHAKLSTE